MTHICVCNLNIIGPDNDLSPGRRQAIIWTNAGILLIEPWGTNFSEMLIHIHTFSFKKIHLKMASAKWCPFCLGLNVLTIYRALCRLFVWRVQGSPHRNFQGSWANFGGSVHKNNDIYVTRPQRVNCIAISVLRKGMICIDVSWKQQACRHGRGLWIKKWYIWFSYEALISALDWLLSAYKRDKWSGSLL